MDWYRITLTPLSGITKLPTAETLFGAFCWAYADLYGEQALESMLEEYETKPFFVVSSVFPKNYVPMPLIIRHFLLPKEEVKNAEKQKDTFEKLKRMCECSYIHLSLFQKFLTDGKLQSSGKAEQNFWLPENEKVPALLFQDETRNSIDLYTGSASGETGQLFYEQRLYTDNETFEFYLKTTNIKQLLPLFRYIEDSGIGKKKSLGFQHFHFDIERCDPLTHSLSYRFLWSSFIPKREEIKAIQWDKSFYQFTTGSLIAEQRTNDNIRKDTITKLIAEGATMKMETNQPYIGQLIKMQSSSIRNYAVGFLV